MATIHVLQWFALFIVAAWFSKATLMDRGGGIRWRQFVSALVSAILWLPLAFASTRVADGATGVVTTYGSEALGWIAMLMVLVMVLTAILSLVLWSQEEAEESFDELASDLPGPQR